MRHALFCFQKLTMNLRYLFTREFGLSIVGEQPIDFLLNIR